MLKTAYSLFKIPNDEALSLILDDRNSSHGTLKKTHFLGFAFRNYSCIMY